MTETNKNKLVEINELYKYLLFIYNETKNDFVTLPTKELNEKFVVKKGNPKLLTKYDLLLSQEFQYGKNKSQMYIKYKWNKSIPTYKLTYDYYYMARNNKNRYVDLENIVINPNEYNINQFNFALAVIGRHEELSGYKEDTHTISTSINITNKPIKIKENQKKPDQLLLPELNEPNNNDNKLNEFINGINKLENVLDMTKQQISEIVNLLKLMINTIRENSDITSDTYSKVASLQNSVGKTIAVSVTNQKNLFTIVPSLLMFFKDKHNTLNEQLKIISPTHEDYNKLMKEKEDIDFGLNKIRGQLNENNNIEQKYR